MLAPPYDVVGPLERAALASRSPYNAIHVELPEADEGTDPYRAAAARLGAWASEGILLRETEPKLYGYRMSYSGQDGSSRSTTGVLGALALEEPGKGDVLPHERTLPKARSDRMELLRATGVNTSPVWGLSLAHGLRAALEPSGPPACRGVDSSGVTHELFILGDDATRAVEESIGSAPLVIADGHHRWETALEYARDCHPTQGEGPWDYALAFVVELVDEELDVGAIHRLLRSSLSPSSLRELLGRGFAVEKLDGGTGLATAGLVARLPVLLDAEGTWALRAHEDVTAKAEEDLDAARLAVILDEAAEVEVSFANSFAEASEAIGDGQADAAVLLRPASVRLIRDVAAARRRMPPKSTFFRPKPATGMVFRSLSD